MPAGLCLVFCALLVTSQCLLDPSFPACPCAYNQALFLHWWTCLWSVPPPVSYPECCLSPLLNHFCDLMVYKLNALAHHHLFLLHFSLCARLLLSSLHLFVCSVIFGLAQLCVPSLPQNIMTHSSRPRFGVSSLVNPFLALRQD